MKQEAIKRHQQETWEGSGDPGIVVIPMLCVWAR